MAALRCKPFLSAQAFKASSIVYRPATSTVRAMASKADTIKQTVSGNKVVVYSKTYCPYCTTVKGLFADLQVPAVVLELDKSSDGAEMQDTLQSITGRRTVPQVFVNGNFIGGCDDTLAAHREGKLKGLLAEAGITVK